MAYTHQKEWATNGKYWYLPEIAINGLVIHSVGCAQPRASVFVKNFNNPNARASVHGFIEPGLFIETAPIFEKKGRAKKCYHVGSGPKGSYNSSRIGIEMCEPGTIKYTGGASFKDLNPEATKKYIREVTATAAEVFADLCIFHNIPVSMIISHKGACAAGYGSNHGDPEHMWNYIGYSLEQFRKDVQKIINEKKGDVLQDMTKQELQTIIKEAIAASQPKTYKTLADIPEWARATVRHAMDVGCIAGTGETADNGQPVLNLTHDLLRTIVVLDRAGVFDIKKD